MTYFDEGSEPGSEPALPDHVLRRMNWAALRLAPKIEAFEALVQGLPAARSKMDKAVLREIGEPLRGPALSMTPELALRIAAAAGADAGEHAPDPEPFTGVSHDKVIALTFEGERHLVADLIEAGSVGTYSGVPETYKSFLALQTAVAVALGSGEVLGREVVAQGPVGYFWQDDSRRNEAERVQQHAAAHPTPEGVPLTWFLNEGLELPRDLARLRASIEHHGFVLVILDSFYNLVTGVALKEEEAGRIIARLKADVCDPTECAVLIVDHAPWPTEANRGQRRAYGSVIKGAAVRWGVYLERRDGKLYVEARGNNIRGLKSTLCYFDAEALELRLVEAVPREENEAAIEAAILAYLDAQTEPQATKHVLDGVRDAGVKARDATYKEALDRLSEAGRLTVVGPRGGPITGRPREPKYWSALNHAGLESAEQLGLTPADSGAGASASGVSAQSALPEGGPTPGGPTPDQADSDRAEEDW